LSDFIVRTARAGSKAARAGSRAACAGLRAAQGLLEQTLATLLPADCLLCAEPLPWRQNGGVCLPCWDRLPWSPGLRRRAAASSSRALEAVAWAADYDGPVRRLIQALKFEGADQLGRHLGESAARHLGPLLGLGTGSCSGALFPFPDLVVPVPLHWWRRLFRGYNQAGLLAAPIARAAGLPLVTDLLRRPRAGRRQTGLSRGERLRSLSGSYRAEGPSLRGAAVLLVDDVVTTGATLEACARELRRAGAMAVFGFALARTPRRGSAGGPGGGQADPAEATNAGTWKGA